jgi:hypothetical protein
LKDTVVDGRGISKYLLEEQGGGTWLELIWLRIETSGGFL